MWDILRKLALALLAMPEKGETEPDSLYQWRVRVALTIFILGGAQLIFIVFAFGYLSFVGWNGFALASDVQQLVKQGHDTRLSQLERTIKDDRTLQCQAIMEGNRSSMDYAYFHLQTDIDAYAMETRTTMQPGGIAPRIPECSELIPAISTNVIAPTPTPKISVVPPAIIR